MAHSWIRRWQEANSPAVAGSCSFLTPRLANISSIHWYQEAGRGAPSLLQCLERAHALDSAPRHRRKQRSQRQVQRRATESHLPGAGPPLPAADDFHHVDAGAPPRRGSCLCIARRLCSSMSATSSDGWNHGSAIHSRHLSGRVEVGAPLRDHPFLARRRCPPPESDRMKPIHFWEWTFHPGIGIFFTNDAVAGRRFRHRESR